MEQADHNDLYIGELPKLWELCSSAVCPVLSSSYVPEYVLRKVYYALVLHFLGHIMRGPTCSCTVQVYNVHIWCYIS